MSDLSENDRKNTGLTASEERVNVDRRWLGTSVVRIRVLAAGLVLLGAGCAVLGWGSRSRQTAANLADQRPAIRSRPGVGYDDCAMLPGVGKAPGSPNRALRSTIPGAIAVCRTAADLRAEPRTGESRSGDARAKFVTRGSGYSLFLGSEGAILSMASQKFEGRAVGG